MLDHRLISVRWNIIFYLLVVFGFPVVWYYVVTLPSWSLPTFLYGSNGLTFAQFLFNSALVISTFIITMAPVTYNIFKEYEDDVDRVRKYLRVYVPSSIIVLFLVAVVCSIFMANTWYILSMAGSLYLLTVAIAGYFLLCFPFRSRTQRATQRATPRRAPRRTRVAH